MVQLFGPKSRNVLNTVDRPRDRELRARFAAEADDYRALRHNDDGSLTLVVGYQWWPLPIPLVKSGAGWQFDIDAGAQEVVNRRIGENELDAIAMLHGFVEAQLAYAGESRDGSGVHAFARKLLSASGRKDGLYWRRTTRRAKRRVRFPRLSANPAPATRRCCVMAIAIGFSPRRARAPPAALQLRDQRPPARRLRADRLPRGVWQTGVMTFIVNHYGDVYEKNLGPDTATIAARIAVYGPDASWRRVED